MILFELTGEYSIILPLMLAIVLATVISRMLSRDTVYTLKLRRRGIDLEGPAAGAAIGGEAVASVMEPLPTPVADSLELAEVTLLLSRSEHGALPVRDPEGAYLGIVTARAVTEALTEQPDGAPSTTGDLVEMPHRVTADQQLVHALQPLLSASGTGLPVLDAGGDEPVGWLSHQGALRSLHPPQDTPTAAPPR